MHRVIKYFTDLQDDEYPYNVGDTYPREGVVPSTERIEELSGGSNLQGTPLIEPDPETESQAESDIFDAEALEIEETPKKPAGKRTAKK